MNSIQQKWRIEGLAKFEAQQCVRNVGCALHYMALKQIYSNRKYRTMRSAHIGQVSNRGSRNEEEKETEWKSKCREVSWLKSYGILHSKPLLI